MKVRSFESAGKFFTTVSFEEAVELLHLVAHWIIARRRMDISASNLDMSETEHDRLVSEEAERVESILDFVRRLGES